MQIKKLILGDLATNCYLLIKDKMCIIIDPADDADKIKDEVGNLKVLTILITHYHFDHIGALKELKDYYKVQENNFLLVDNMKVINTPGHTKDSLTYYFPKDNLMFCGDFLFKDTFGRTDLDTGDNQDMINSLDKISKYNDNIILLPGHGEQTSLLEEKKNFLYYKQYLKNN